MPMAGDNEKDKKGFSGLSDLASEISGIDEPIKQGPKAESNPSAPKHSPQPQRETATSETERKTTSSTPPIETVSLGKSGGGSGGKWILGIIGVVFVIWLINNGGQSNKKPSYNPPFSSQSVNYSQNSPESTVAAFHNRSTHQQIIEVQTLLKELDYDPEPIDGQYGSQTASAVMTFQKDMGLSPDGRIDQNLINSLNKTKSTKNLIAPQSNSDFSNKRALAQEIESGKAQAKQMEIQIKNMDSRLEDYERKIIYYRASGMIDKYNLLVPTFNALVNERKDLYERYSNLIAEVNAKVNRFNSSHR